MKAFQVDDTIKAVSQLIAEVRECILELENEDVPAGHIKKTTPTAGFEAHANECMECRWRVQRFAELLEGQLCVCERNHGPDLIGDHDPMKYGKY